MNKEILRSKIENRCIYFNGYSHGTCEAGVCYATIKGSSCFRKYDTETDLCAERKWPDEEYITQKLAAIEENDRKMALTATLIKTIKVAHKGQNWQGIEVCPVCGDELHLSHAGCNGHVWGKCKTENCLAWME